jgi:hypothetical protein
MAQSRVVPMALTDIDNSNPDQPLDRLMLFTEDGDPIRVSAVTGHLIGAGGAYFDVQGDFGGRVDGVTDDTDALYAAGQAASAAGGGEVWVGYGTLLARSVTFFPNVMYAGAGKGMSTLYRANGVNADFVKTLGFDTNTGTTNIGTDHDYGLRKLTLAGNSANNTTGRGVAAFGYRPVYDDIEIVDFNGLGLYNEWRATGGTPSAGLAHHDMHGRIRNCDVHDNLGGGIHWAGPSDSNMSMTEIYRNGSTTTGSTTNGLRLSGNANSMRAHLCHAWGNQHGVSVLVEAPGFQSHECDWEGAPFVIDSFNGVIKGGKLFSPAPGSDTILQVGVLGHSTCGGWDIDTYMPSCNINLVRDGGGHVWKVHAFWTDSTKKLFNGTMSAGTSSHFDCLVDGGLQLGLTNFTAVAKRTARIRDIFRIANAGRPDNIIAESFPRPADQNLTGFTLGQWVIVLLSLEAGVPITGISFIPGAALPTSPSNCWYALFNPTTKAIIASTIDDVTGLAVDTPHPLALSGSTPWVPDVDQRVYAACNMNAASGTFTLEGKNGTPGSGKLAPQQAGLASAGITDPTTWANAPLPGIITGGTKIPYAYVY